ncbi:hypothetical protein K491DRAFT_723278 [Lophiostoma macrostomum CBS 122681]|uniref:Uncharacterized protein n=1 Tax=Lophiostoma macrostomum CBS 122681 TaxID=1314788 RepID=A0A6A6SIK1_9PLEO|nr:hypothetical protein K491DRAFT_723278 [Lophiostoma macrostomum CBS 122681]
MQLTTIFWSVTVFALAVLLVLAPPELQLSLLGPLCWASASTTLDSIQHHRLLRFVRNAATTLLLLRLYAILAVFVFGALVDLEPVFSSALVACGSLTSLALSTGHSLFSAALDACTAYASLWTPIRPSLMDLVRAWTPLGDSFRAGDWVADLWDLFGDDVVDCVVSTLSFVHRTIGWTLFFLAVLLFLAAACVCSWDAPDNLCEPVVLPEYKPAPLSHRDMYPDDAWYHERVVDGDFHAAFARVQQKNRQMRKYRFA